MKHRKILNAALFGAEVASGFDKLDVATVAPLYDYCRDRKFPPAETLARKFSEMRGEKFPFASLAAAPEGVRVFFATFRAIAEVLEPFRETGSEGEPPEAATPATLGADDEGTGARTASPEMEQAGTEARGGAAAGDAGISSVVEPGPGETAQLDDPVPADRGEPTDPVVAEDDPGPPIATTETGQAETDAAIAASGGQFSQSADSAPAKSKKKNK